MASDTAHIIGGGPSASRLDFSMLRGRGTVIGVNDSFFNAPCDAVVSIDGRWMRHRWQKLKDANATAWLRRDSFEKHVGIRRVWPALTLGECLVWGDNTGPGLHCLHGNNSGLVSLNYVYWRGFKKIFLYGFDMGYTDKKHWYPEYEWSAKGNHMYPAFISQFEQVAQTLKANGCRVFNVSPTSKLEVFEKVDYATAQDYF